jgi:hypothetical protein
MDNEKVNAALLACRSTIVTAIGDRGGRVFGDLLCTGERNQKATDSIGRCRHLLWMIDEARSWPAERLEKKFRWLGFIQGTLWVEGILPIAEAKEMNKPAADVSG